MTFGELGENSSLDYPPLEAFAGGTTESLLPDASSRLYQDSAPRLSKVTDQTSESDGGLKRDLASDFGIEVKEANGRYQYSFHADGKEHLVHESGSARQDLLDARIKLSELTAARMTSIKSSYKAEFATAGESVDRTYNREADCTYSRRDMIHAIRPTLPQLYAVEEGLRRSAPSHLTADGQDGVKIYFLDKQIIPTPYGNKPALGLFIENDKDDRRALFITPDGGRLAPTSKDTKSPGERDLKTAIIHELTHNSQENFWPDEQIDPSIAESMGWQRFTQDFGKHGKWDFYFLKGKNGELYSNDRVDGCNNPTTWIARNAYRRPIDAQGKVVDYPAKAQRLTNEEVMDRALVRPNTYYFPNPMEMLSEGLTALRESRESRERLFRSSPEIYGVARSYDENEIGRFYSLDPTGSPPYLRSPDGILKPRDRQSEEEIRRFEESLK